MGERSLADSTAPLGYGTTRVLDRLLATCGLLDGAALAFTADDDVPQAGVLCALPALLTEGLLRHTRIFYTLPPGYYPLEAIFLYLALLALVRCRSLEQTRYQAPGEWGRMLGLDRLPEVKTLRAKIATLCAAQGRAAQWQSGLAKDWIEAAGDPAEVPGLGVFYVDGHVRVYHGALTSLPRRYVARQRLCLRGTTDYWVNGLGGEPFFVVTAPVNSGLIAALRDQVIPQLLAATTATAATPTPPATTAVTAAASAKPVTPRFSIVFDREGYSPELFAELKAQGIAILTYHKFPGAAWPEAEFYPHRVRLHTGEVVLRELAERGTRLSNGLWVREVRVRGTDAHQTSILATHPHWDLPALAARMAARWCQENFLKYMRENFGLDRIIEHGTTELPDATIVVNPARRQLEADVRRHRATVLRSQARLGALTLPTDPSVEQSAAFLTHGGELREAIAAETARLDARKAQRPATPKKLPLKDLPADARFAQLCPESKHFIDTIKMIAYRAESALAGEARETLARSDDARALLRRLFVTPANLRPDYSAHTLTVELHRLGSPLQDNAVLQLCETLTATETCFPTTDLRLVYRQVGSG